MINKLSGWYRKSLKNRIMLILLAGTLLPVFIISIIVYIVTVNVIYANSSSAIGKNLVALSASVDIARFKMASLSDDIYYNVAIREVLLSENSQLGVLERYHREEIIQSALAQLSIRLNYRNRIVLVDRNNTLYASFGSEVPSAFNYSNFLKLFNERYLSLIPREEYSIEWLKTDKELFESDMLSMTRYIRDNNGKYLGKIYVFVDTNIVNDLFLQQGYSLTDEVMIINSEGLILCHLNNKLIGKNIYNVIAGKIPENKGYTISTVSGKKKLISITTLSNSTWKLINVVPTEILLVGIDVIYRAIVFSITIVGIISFIIQKIISSKITWTLNYLKQKSVDIGHGNLDVSISVEGEDELSELARCMDQMVKRIKMLISDIIHQQEMNTILEIKAYQSQLNPHFLYNTLNNIKWIAISRQEQQIADMITLLGRILERVMRNSSGMSKVKEEIELLENYIHIQQFRYNGKFNVSFEFDDELMQLYIPILILQPILENSMFHGIGKKKHITIRLNGFLKNDQVILQVIDNGNGISEERLEHLWDEYTDKNKHIGLLNVKRRIQLKFGSNYDLRIESREGEGTTVEINMPVIKEFK